jgi:hypothetical protein
MQDHAEVFSFAVTDTGKSDVIIGFNWLKQHNPEIDWQRQTIRFSRCPAACKRARLWEEWEEEDNTDIGEGDRIFVTKMYPEDVLDTRDSEHLRAMGSVATKLAAAAHEAKGAKTLEESVPAHYLEEFRGVFEKKDFDKLPERRKWDHAIELKPGAEPVKGRSIPLSVPEQAELDAFIKEHVETGRIRPSKSPWASPFFFVKKKDGKLRPVQDYRKLNSLTIKNRYPLPLISEIMHMLRKATWFTKLDVRWGYNNIRIKEGDEEKAAFVTNRGLWEPLVMFFGLTNSPATFQCMMNDIFADLIAEGRVIVYLDDILIYSEHLEEHRSTVKEVLRILQENELFLKPEK